MAEDAFYSQSTQFESWQFPKAKLAAIRKQTNERGIRSIRRTWKKARDEAAAAIALGQGRDEADPGGKTPEQVDDPEPLTIEEEARLVLYYCVKTIELSDHLQFPSNVKATAVTFLRRFHLHHSPLIYHPKHHLPTVLFLATKTENHYIPLSDFCKRIPIPKLTEEAVLKHEFLVAGGVQWDLDVRHPLRAAEGAIMELLSLISSNEPSSMHGGGASWQDGLGRTKREAADRVKEAHGKMKSQLTTSALLSDAYFLYTPPQIFLGALHNADAGVADFYVNWKFGDNSHAAKNSKQNSHKKASNGESGTRLDVDKLLSTIKACAELLKSADTSSTPALEEVKRIDKKLYVCQNPHKYIPGHPGKSATTNTGTKASTPAINAVGEGGNGGGSAADESQQQKKRRLEREKAVREGDVFGGPAAKDSGSNGGGGGSSGSAAFGEMLKRKQAET